ncbi:MAG: ABC transporter permease [Flavobacteriaceae bacterium]
MVRNNVDIQKFLPHRYPMLMVDTVLHIDSKSVTCEFKVGPDCLFLKNGHLTETGLIENAAQACSAVVGQNYFEADDLEGKGNKVIGYISAIKKVVIKKLPKLNDTLVTKAQLISLFNTGNVSMCTMEGTTFSNGDLIVDCTINFLIHEVL